MPDFKKPVIVRTIADLRPIIKKWKDEGYRIGLVPTMGALHAGHLSLVDTISNHCDKVITTIFVNAKQFGENEDLDAYPRTEESDRHKLSLHPCDLIFSPINSEIYPSDFQSKVTLSMITKELEGASRPGHFDGVATIVTKLFNICTPDIAIFGEKDYQQLQVIKAIVKDLNMDVEILGGEIIREEDGLAMSSRNAYLSPDDRKIAGKLNIILSNTAKEIKSGTPIHHAENKATQALLEAGFIKVDYISVRDSQTLKEIDTISNRPARILAVARIGTVRLLDNVELS